MKTLFQLCLLLFGLSAFGADVITATIIVTNAPTINGNTLTVNANVRSWINAVTIPGSQILTNSTIGGSATNMFNAISITPFTGLTLARSGTNGITLRTAPSGALAVTLSAGWGSVVLTTNTTTAAVAVRVPYGVEAAAQQTNITSGIVAMVGANANTNSIPAAALSMANFDSLSGTQTLSGAKSLMNAANSYIGAAIINGTLTVTNSANISALSLIGSSGTGGQTYSLQSTPSGLSMSGSANNLVSMAGGLTLGGTLTLGGDVNMLNFSITGGRISMGTNGFIGNGASLTNIPGEPGIQVGTVDGPLLTNQLVMPGKLTFPRFAVTTLANGNNAGVVAGTNVFVEVSGPGAAFAINGIAGGRDGQFLIVLNRTTYAMTIANDSGVDATAANRIYTMSGADRYVTANGTAILIYSGSASRWILISLDPGQSEFRTTTKTANYTVTGTDYTIRCDTSGGGFTVTLPASPTTGQVVNIKKITTDSNTLTISGNGHNIDGGTPVTTASTSLPNYQLQYNGSSWDIL